LNSKTSLILGCAGQDGSLMCHSLLKKGEKIIGLSRSQTNQIPNHLELGIDKKIESKKGDIRNFSTLADLIETYKPDKIFNFAAQSSVGKSFTYPIETIEGIVNGTINILEVARKLNFQGKIFFAGSSEMFGLTKVRANVNHHQNPGNPYAIGKQTSFNLVKFYRENYKVNCSTGVLFNHESHLRTSNFVTQKIIEGVIQSSKNKTHRITLGNVEIKRDWGWAPEYMEAIFKITEAAKSEDHIICTGKLTSLMEFIKIAYSKLNLNWKDHVIIDDKLKRKNEILQSFGDPMPIYKKLNWKSQVDVEEIITKLIEFKIKQNSKDINNSIRYF
tara:strand:+ start:410 stop:1402 length:993 start_codon:yes stop_codon:yes gene_type:complete